MTSHIEKLQMRGKIKGFIINDVMRISILVSRTLFPYVPMQGCDVIYNQLLISVVIIIVVVAVLKQAWATSFSKPFSFDLFLTLFVVDLYQTIVIGRPLLVELFVDLFVDLF